MKRYFFDTGSDGNTTCIDDSDLPDLAAVRCEALITACEMIREDPDIWNGSPWKLSVTDEHGALVCLLVFHAESATKGVEQLFKHASKR